MSDDPRSSNAHFLHEKSGLEAVLSAPLERPRAMDWVGTSTRLIVATADGELVEVDPVFGTRTLKEETHEPAELKVSPTGKHFAVVERGQRVVLFATGNGKAVAEHPCDLISDISMSWFRNKSELALVLCGNTLEGQKAWVLDADFKKARHFKLPRGAQLGPGKDGRLLMARVSPQGIDVVSFGKKLSPAKPTSHRLRFAPQGQLMGVANGGVTVWRGPGDPTHTVAMLDVTAAAVSPDGQRVDIGSRSGEVALASIDGPQLERGRPGKIGGHTTAVRSIRFGENRGNWVATIADRLRIWKY